VVSAVPVLQHRHGAFLIILLHLSSLGVKRICRSQYFLSSRLGAKFSQHGEIAHLKVPCRDWPPRRQGTSENYDAGGEAGHRHEGFKGCGGVSEAEAYEVAVTVRSVMATLQVVVRGEG